VNLLRPRRQAGPRRQRGAIAIMFAVLLFVLLAAGGLVIDLGHLYVLKSELQNGADSGALAGAKELNMTSGGITLAAAKALAFSQQNKFDFSSALVLTNSNVTFSSSPDGPWVSVGEAQASPSGKSFIKVDTGNKTVPTYLMRVSGRTSMTTAGVAVAGRFVVDITPLGVCAVDPLNRLGARLFGLEKELLEYGFRRGTTYDMLQLKNIAGSSDPMLINPVDSPPTACSASNSSANFTAPFLCQGNSAVTNNATAVYANTGVSAGPVEKALNSRFNDYSGGSPCIPASAPPDRNVKEYVYNTTVDWMNPVQTAQSQVIDSATGKPSTATQASNKQGVLWTYSRPLNAVGSDGSFAAGAPLTTADWPALYNGTAADADYPAGISASPYAETSGAHFLAPATNTPTNNRRLMNLAIVNCTVPAGSGSCKQIPLLGIGRFFLQRKAALTGSDKGIWVEFAGLIEPVPNSEIKLYR
jgi:Flp pilus assembly protein TadG